MVKLLIIVALVTSCSGHVPTIEKPTIDRGSAGMSRVCIHMLRSDGESRDLCSETVKSCKGDRWMAESYGARAGLVAVGPCTPVILMPSDEM